MIWQMSNSGYRIPAGGLIGNNHYRSQASRAAPRGGNHRERRAAGGTELPTQPSFDLTKAGAAQSSATAQNTGSLLSHKRSDSAAVSGGRREEVRLSAAIFFGNQAAFQVNGGAFINSWDVTAAQLSGNVDEACQSKHHDRPSRTTLQFPANTHRALKMSRTASANSGPLRRPP